MIYKDKLCALLLIVNLMYTCNCDTSTEDRLQELERIVASLSSQMNDTDM